MSFMSHSDESDHGPRSVSYSSTALFESESLPGVQFRIRRISAARRLDLMRGVRGLAQRIEFHDAGSTPVDRLEAALLSKEIDRLYFRECLEQVHGLLVDGKPPTTELVWDSGPEGLTNEIVAKAKQECHLSEAERKN